MTRPSRPGARSEASRWATRSGAQPDVDVARGEGGEESARRRASERPCEDEARRAVPHAPASLSSRALPSLTTSARVEELAPAASCRQARARATAVARLARRAIDGAAAGVAFGRPRPGSPCRGCDRGRARWSSWRRLLFRLIGCRSRVCPRSSRVLARARSRERHRDLLDADAARRGLDPRRVRDARARRPAPRRRCPTFTTRTPPTMRSNGTWLAPQTTTSAGSSPRSALISSSRHVVRERLARGPPASRGRGAARRPSSSGMRTCVGRRANALRGSARPAPRASRMRSSRSRSCSLRG